MHTSRTALARVTTAIWCLVLPLAWVLASAVHGARERTRRISMDDRGSETVEKAVMTALMLGLALGLAGVIAAVVHKYQGQIH